MLSHKIDVDSIYTHLTASEWDKGELVTLIRERKSAEFFYTGSFALVRSLEIFPETNVRERSRFLSATFFFSNFSIKSKMNKNSYHFQRVAFDKAIALLVSAKLY